MNHPNDDTLLHFVLRTAGETECSDIEQHVSHCENCREREQKLRMEVERFGAVQMRVDLPELPRLSGQTGAVVRKWGWAAGLAAGFLLGILTASLANSESPVAVPQRLVTVERPNPPTQYIPCQALDVRAVPRP